MSTPVGPSARCRSTVGVAAAICAPRRRLCPHAASLRHLIPATTKVTYAKQYYTRSARSCPSKQQPLFLPTSLLGEVVPCQSLPPPPLPLPLPVSWPDSPVSGAGARNSRFGLLIDLTADRGAPSESSILALTLPCRLTDGGIGGWFSVPFRHGVEARS